MHTRHHLRRGNRATIAKAQVLALAAAMLVTGSVTSQPATAANSTGPTASVGAVSLDKNLVVRANQSGGLTASATVTGSFDSDSTVAPSGSGWGGPITSTSTIAGSCGSVNQSQTWTKSTTVYTDKTLNIDGSRYTPDGKGAYAYTKTITSFGADGSYTVTISATASELKTVTTYSATEYRNKISYHGTTTYCYPNGSAWTAETVVWPTGTPTDTTLTGTTASASASYLVDLVAPDISGSVNAESGFVEEGQALNTTLSVDNGSAGQAIEYTVHAQAQNPDVNAVTDRFDGSGTSRLATNPTGISNKHAIASGVFLPCGLSLGIYTVSATVTTYDLAGDPWPTVTVPVGTTTVRTASNLSADNFVVAQLADGSYGTVDQFTVTSAKKKGVTGYSSNIGTVHFGALLTTPGRCQSTGATYSLTDQATKHLVLMAPAGFAFVQTGASPFAHVFAGFLAPGATLDYHDGNLSSGEITSLVKQVAALSGSTVTSGTADRIEVNLAALGTNFADYKVYVRAKMQYVGGAAPSGGALFSFADAVDNFNLTLPAIPASNSSTYCLAYVNTDGSISYCS